MEKIETNKYFICDECGFKIKKPEIKIEMSTPDDVKFYLSPLSDSDEYTINNECVELGVNIFKENIQNFNDMNSEIMLFKCPNCNKLNIIDLYTTTNPLIVID